MNTRHFVFFIIPFLLISCAGLKEKPVTVENSTYLDSNIPKVKITFPFKLTMESRNIDYYEQLRQVTHRLKSQDNMKTVIIDKESLLNSRYFFTGTDSSSETKPFFLRQEQSGFCAVNSYNEKNNTFLKGISVRYIADNVLSKVRVFEYVGEDRTKEDLAANDKLKIDRFIEDMKTICTQNTRRK